MSGRRDRACGVQKDGAAATAVGAGEDVANRLGVLGRGAAAELLEAAGRKPQFGLGIELALVDRSVDHLSDEILPDRGKLVDAARAVDDECTFRSERSHVNCRLAYARVRRLVSAIAASSAIVPATTAAASR